MDSNHDIAATGSVTINAWQLKQALDCAAPDFNTDEDQRETEVDLKWLPERIAIDGEKMEAGLYLWWTDYPEEGVVLLDDRSDTLPKIEDIPKLIRERTATYTNYLMMLCHSASDRAGLWEDKAGFDIRENPYCFSNKLMLIVSELAEAMEGDRKGLMDDHLDQRAMREVELADALIRIFDLAGAYGMDIGGALAEKMAYNANRADHKPEARGAAGGKTY